MRVLQKILFTFAMVVGLSLAVSAQKDGPKKPPPKGPPPVINPAPPKNPPPESKKPKNPSSDEFAWDARKNDTGETV